jgi:CO/xanthine dehydrogenase Mo-binding subunit
MEDDGFLDLERYELAESLPYRLAVGRRGFLQLVGVVVLVTVARSEAQESGRRIADESGPSDLAAWLHIAEDGTVTVYTGKVEVGQNARTSLTQAVADELHAPVEAIRLVMGDTDLTPYDMGTFGSRTTPTMAPRIRRAAAAARELLKDEAAKEWSMPASELEVADGHVSHGPSGRLIAFGNLTKGRKLVRALGEDSPTTAATQWTVAGRSLPKVDGRDFVTGSHRYTSDVTREGMLHGRVLRPPAIGAVLETVDLSPAEAMAGVVAVRDGDFVGVAAPRPDLAGQALEALRPSWKTVPQPSGRDLYKDLRKPAAAPSSGEGRRPSPYVVGSVKDGLASAAHRLESTYTVAYIAHIPLEPRAAVAEWADGRLTVWTGTQRPFGVKDELAEAFRLAEDKVRVIVPDTGSAYGGKHTGEYAVEAARLAKAAGRPVKVVWSREEEFRWGYFRPAGVIDVRSGVDVASKLVAWEMHNYNSGASAIRTSYVVPNQHIEFHPAESPLRQGSYRGLAATANHFARESHMDELATLLKLDPLEFRRRNLEDKRFLAVLEAAAERFGWEKRSRAPGRGCGIAGGFEKGSYVAACAEVGVDGDGAVRVLRLVAAFECGAIVNPEHLRNQVEGALLMGLGGALFEAVEFDEGKILNPRLSLYRVPRFKDVPELDVVLLDRKDLASAGAGETPIVGIAPAVAGAIFDATGVRLRAMPLAPRGVAKPETAAAKR